MSLLGLDIGTTGVKATVLSVGGDILSRAYREYDILSPGKGWMELDSRTVWDRISEVITEAASKSRKDPVTALSVSSFGEAATPVSEDREILGNCILFVDERGREYVPEIEEKIGAVRIYEINGNVCGHTVCDLITVVFTLYRDKFGLTG